MASEYRVVPMSTSFFSGSLDPKKLEGTLNEYAKQGWKFERSIHETKGTLIKREAHFLIFSK